MLCISRRLEHILTNGAKLYMNRYLICVFLGALLTSAAIAGQVTE